MGGTMRLGADPVKLHAGHPRPRGLRRAGHLRAPPPPLRGQQPAAPPARGRRPRVQRDVAGRPARRGDRAAASTRSSWPRSTTPSSSRGPNRPAPLFRGFVGAALERARARAPEATERGGRAAPCGARITGGARTHHRPSASAERAVERATDSERARLADLFVRLCEIPSPTGDEARDGRGRASRAGGASGWRSTRTTRPARPAPGAGTCWRASRRPIGAPTMLALRPHRHGAADRAVEVDGSEGVFRNRNDAILGADNKAAVAVLPPGRAGAGPRVARRSGVELLFTTSEETGLRGAKAFDRERLHADFGYVFDHASPIGGLVVAAPTHYAVTADFLGRAAHAGIRPEAGRNAIVAAAQAIGRIASGRIDAETTLNVGVIQGGTAGERRGGAMPCRHRGAQPRRPARRATSSSQVVDACTWAASATETDVDSHVEEHFRAYRIPDSRSVRRGRRPEALRDCGIEPVLASIRRWQRRERVRGPWSALPQRRQRHRGEPHLRRARHARERSRRCSM